MVSFLWKLLQMHKPVDCYSKGTKAELAADQYHINGQAVLQFSVGHVASYTSFLLLRCAQFTLHGFLIQKLLSFKVLHIY